MQGVGDLTAHQFISKFPNEWFSLHRRGKESQIILFHIFLDFFNVKLKFANNLSGFHLESIAKMELNKSDDHKR